ncbi:MAG: hypothetical protein GY774_11600 [Planctomycetes bacterium]|nr:hypothetical protein [Planctomycetota bacterium]
MKDRSFTKLRDDSRLNSTLTSWHLTTVQAGRAIKMYYRCYMKKNGD